MKFFVTVAVQLVRQPYVYKADWLSGTRFSLTKRTEKCGEFTPDRDKGGAAVSAQAKGEPG